MTREIEFRGKCSHCDAWAYGSLVDYGENEAPEIHGFDPYREADERWREITVDSDTVGQFTGLVDKNGVKIFEGDILKLVVTNIVDKSVSKPKIRKVIWKDCGFYIVDKYNSCICDKVSSSDVLEYTVIGNIHDNPELLSK